MATYHTQYQMPRAYSIPVIVSEWSPLVNALQVQSSYTSVPHIPVPMLSRQMLTSVSPYTVVPEPVSNNILDDSADMYADITDVYDSTTSDGYTNEPEYTNVTSEFYTNFYSTNTQETENYTEDYIEEVTLPVQIAEAVLDETDEKDPVEFYLTLPKELFPKAKMLNIDPNSIIDEFCKIPSVNENVSWILDVEFGVPRVPVTRSIAVYDVKLNSIHCKNTPAAIHPGFEKCSIDLKKIILLYYDCVVSIWYRGYNILKYDSSVENFQSWLLIPMQIFGMCWP